MTSSARAALHAGAENTELYLSLSNFAVYSARTYVYMAIRNGECVCKVSEYTFTLKETY
jgi:hypothetical protein